MLEADMSKLTEYLKIFTLATGMSLGGSFATQAQESQNKVNGDENKIENVTLSNNSEQISEEEAKARLLEIVDEYKANPESYNEDIDLIRAMVVGGSLQAEDLTTEHLMSVSAGLTNEDIETMKGRQGSLDAEFAKRYGRGQLTPAQIKDGYMNDLLVKVNHEDIPKIMGQLNEQDVLALNNNDSKKSSLIFGYISYYQQNPAEAKKDELITVLNSPIGKGVLDKKYGINLRVDQAEQIIIDIDNNQDNKVDLNNIGMSREALLGYALDKNIDNLNTDQVVGILKNNSIMLEGDNNPLSLDLILDNMENSANLCSKGLDYALDSKYLDLSNSSNIFSDGSSYPNANVVSNVLNYSVKGNDLKNQDNQNHINNYIRIVDVGGYFIEKGFETNNKNLKDAGKFISTEIEKRGKFIRPESELFVTTPGFANSEGWKACIDKTHQLQAAAGVLEGAIVYNAGSAPGTKGGEIFYNYFRYKNGEKFPKQYEEYLLNLEKTCSEPPFSPTFLKDLDNYAKAVCSGKKKDIKAAAHVANTNNNLNLKDDITPLDERKPSQTRIVNFLDEVNKPINKQIEENQGLYNMRNNLIYKGVDQKSFMHAGLYEEKDLVYEGCFRGGHVTPDFAGMIADERFQKNHNNQEDQEKMVAMFKDYYINNVGKEETTKLLSDILKTDKGAMFLKGMGKDIALPDFEKIEAKGVLRNKNKEFIDTFYKAKDGAKQIAASKQKNRHELAAKDTQYDDLAMTFASVIPQQDQVQEQPERQEITNRINELRGRTKSARTSTPPKDSTLDLSPMFIKRNSQKTV